LATRTRVNHLAKKPSPTPEGVGPDEAGYRRLVELSPMPIAVHIRGKLVFANPATAKLMGAESPKELIGLNVMDFVHPDSRALVMRRMALIYTDHETQTDIVIEKLIRLDGEIINVEIATLLFEYEGEMAIQLILRDITEREKAREALIASEKRFRELADAMPQMVWSAEPDGTVDYRNSQWFNFVGISPDDSDRHDWYAMIHPDDRQLAADLWLTGIKTGEPIQNEIRMQDVRNPGKYRWFLSRVVPIKDDQGNIVKWYGTSTDVDDVRRTTERKKELEHLTAALTEQRAQLVALNQAKDEFISLASHQLRTPATGVKQYIGMALEGFAGELTPELHTFLARAYESNERQIAIINDLLQVAKVDAGKITLQMNQVELVTLIHGVLHEHASHFVDRNQTIIFKPKFKELHITADPERLRMVLDNLIDNASKYTPADNMIEVTLTRLSGTVQIAIRDEGVGIEPDDIDKIFRKFSRLDNVLSKHVGGSGLGLYWAQKIIGLHEGTITVESTPEVGSTFTITLPS
jgi:PAS domain S-box-containing protein